MINREVPWIGVDLDGTLAKYHDNIVGNMIGEVVEPMKSLILDWIEEDIEVKIFTARLTTGDKNTAIKNIQNWLVKNGMPKLDVTNVKDYYMMELYDDRAVQVEFNTGVIYGESTLKYRRLLKQE
jgi:hypothetical protein